MALLTAQGISRVAIELLVRRLSLPRTVTMVPGDEFSGDNGDTITLRVPQPSAARTQNPGGGALTADDLSEIGVDVQMRHKYHLKNLDEYELNFEIADFARQVTRPQVEAVALGVEDTLVSVMNGLTAQGAAVNWDATSTAADDIDTVLDAREYLSDNDAPAEDRWMACAPDIISRLLKLDQINRVDASGSSDGLRNAIVGRLFGFNIVECNALTAGTAVAYHRSGFALAVRPPANPRGASSSSQASAQGIGLRQVFQYDASTAQDQSLVSTFAGAAAVYENESGDDNARFVKIGTGT